MLEFTFVLEDGTIKKFISEFDNEAVIYFCDKFPFKTYNGSVIRFKSLLEEVSKVKYLHISYHDNEIPF